MSADKPLSDEELHAMREAVRIHGFLDDGHEQRALDEIDRLRAPRERKLEHDGADLLESEARLLARNLKLIAAMREAIHCIDNNPKACRLLRAAIEENDDGD